MNNFGIAISSGIIGGLVTALIVVFFRHLWLTAVSPWYENLVYKDAAIEGEWMAIAKFRNNENTVKWTISRQGHNVTATLVGISGRNAGNVYKFTGQFRNLVLAGAYTSDNKRRLDRGTFTLRLERNGARFVGKCAYYDNEADEIRCGEYTIEPITPNSTSEAPTEAEA